MAKLHDLLFTPFTMRLQFGYAKRVTIKNKLLPKQILA